jgi:uncharacterized protein YjiS (DUF1127 family)
MNTHAQIRPVSTGLSYPKPVEQILRNPAILLAWYRRAQSRIALSKLDQRLLDDIGISAKDAAAEAHKPFWKD